MELTEEYAEEENMQVDHAGFEQAMEAQRTRARSARQDTGSMQVQGGVLGEIKVSSEFIGYEQLETEAVVTSLLKNGELIEEAGEGEEIQFIFDKTPFYAESGGQIADKGILLADGVSVRVTEVQKAPNGQNLHSGIIEKGILKAGVEVNAKVDRTNRGKVVKNHTATHLLHQALKDVLGSHVNQAGSLVGPDASVLTFPTFGQVQPEELKQIEAIVNAKIWANISGRYSDSKISMRQNQWVPWHYLVKNMEKLFELFLSAITASNYVAAAMYRILLQSDYLKSYPKAELARELAGLKL